MIAFNDNLVFDFITVRVCKEQIELNVKPA